MKLEEAAKEESKGSNVQWKIQKWGNIQLSIEEQADMMQQWMKEAVRETEKRIFGDKVPKFIQDQWKEFDTKPKI